jgi:lipopolysaccharide biosynthesis protein
VRVIANYLPQFHPIPENDEWWGKSFTEWTNVAKAKPLFRGHYQPQLPADLGFYDLRVPEVREQQAAMAREYGVEAFCYWHYWFAGERLLERPFQEVLASGRPNFPFCLGWANHTWNGLWSGGDEKRVLKEQTYPGRKDEERHFESLLSAFHDSRYVRIHAKPLFVIYKPLLIPNCRAALEHWRELAQKAGLPGLHLVATLDYNERHWDARGHGFDAVTVWPLPRLFESGRSYRWSTRIKEITNRKGAGLINRAANALWPSGDWIYDYAESRPLLICDEAFNLPHHPIAVPNWDTTARYAGRAMVLHNATPDAFRQHFRDVLGLVEGQPEEERIIFVKSWNEWAEGNHLEPDIRYGRGFLEALKSELDAPTQACRAR